MLQSLVLFGSLVLALGAGVAPAAAADEKKPAAPKVKGGRQSAHPPHRGSPPAPEVKGGAAPKGPTKALVSERKVVRGTLIQIDGNKDKASTITTGPRTTGVLIEWAFPTSARLREKALVKSSNPKVVSPIGVTHLVKEKTPRGHGLAALFAVKGEGKATLTFVVHHGKETVEITSHVHVKGKGKSIQKDKDMRIPVVKGKNIPKDQPKTSPGSPGR
jgi:hypothetical protein